MLMIKYQFQSQLNPKAFVQSLLCRQHRTLHLSCPWKQWAPIFPQQSWFLMLHSCLGWGQKRSENKIFQHGPGSSWENTPPHVERTAKSLLPYSLSSKKLLTHPTLPLSHTKDALVPQVVRNWFGRCWRKGPQRNWTRQCEAAAITLFWFLYLLSASSHLIWGGFFFLFFFEGQSFKNEMTLKDGTKIGVWVVYWPRWLRFKINFEKL